MVDESKILLNDIYETFTKLCDEKFTFRLLIKLNNDCINVNTNDWEANLYPSKFITEIYEKSNIHIKSHNDIKYFDDYNGSITDFQQRLFNISDIRDEFFTVMSNFVNACNIDYLKIR